MVRCIGRIWSNFSKQNPQGPKIFAMPMPMLMLMSRCRSQDFRISYKEMAFKFYKHVSANIKGTLLLHLPTDFISFEYFLLDKLQVKNTTLYYLKIFRMWSRLTVKQSSFKKYCLFWLFYELKINYKTDF